MTPKRSLLVLLAAGAFAVLVSACGTPDDSAPGRPTVPDESSSPTETIAPVDASPTTVVADAGQGTEPPTTAPSTPPARDAGSLEDPVITFGVQGLFPVTQPFLPNGPTVAVFADGTVLVSFRGDFAAQPQVWPYEVGAVEPSEVRSILAEAEAAGLTVGSDHLPLPSGSQIADAPRSTVTIRTGSATFVHTADGLGLIDDADPARAALTAFIGRLSELSMQVPTGGSFYEPVALDLVASVAVSDRAGEPVPWPASAPTLDPDAGCVVVSDPAAVELLDRGLAGTTYRSGDADYVVATRVHLAGSTC